MYFWKYILAKKAGLSQKKCNMALYGLPVLPIAEAFEKTVTGNPISITDALAQDALSLQVAFTPTQDGTPSIDSEPTTEPYLSKVIPRGNKEYYSLVGGTVAWNQMSDNSRSSLTSNGVTFVNNGDGTITANGTATGYAVFNSIEHAGILPIVGHIYLLIGCPTGGAPDKYCIQDPFYTNRIYTDYGSGRIFRRGSESSRFLTQILITKGFTAQNLVFKPQYFDLTLLFANNPAIADYAYTLEQSEAGSGIAWLKSYGFFTKDYYPYSAGELISVKTSGHKVGNTTYPIDPTDLRGLFKLSNGKLYCEGDIYPPSGYVARKYSVPLDLGSVDWLYFSAYDLFYSMSITGYKDGTPFISTLYIDQGAVSVSQINNLCGTLRANAFYIKNTAYTDATAFKTAMSGVYLIAELATPTTETLTAYTSPIDVEAGGTEEFIDNRTVPIPVGNETYYASEYEVNGKTGVTVSHGATGDDPNPTEYEIEFTSQGTVYGGTVDIVTGVLTVTWAILSNPQNLNWITNSSQGMKNFQTASGTVSKKSGSNNWKCSRYSNGFIGTDKAEGIFIFDSGEVCIRDYRYWEHGGTSAEEAAFKASLADVTIAYELATPQTYNLTPEQVTMLLGNNYLETEDGTITITYMAGK